MNVPGCSEDLLPGPEGTHLAVVTGSAVQEATRELGFRKCPAQAPGVILGEWGAGVEVGEGQSWALLLNKIECT